MKKIKQLTFNAVVGNPPYQKMATGDANGSDPVYHQFIDIARLISKQGTLIHPGRFLFGAGKTPAAWNKKMLNDNHFRVIQYWVKSNALFPSVDIKGGVAITAWDRDKEVEPIGTYVIFPELKSILAKVQARGEESFSGIVYSRTCQRLTQVLHDEHPEAMAMLSKGHLLDMSSNIFDLLPHIFFDTKPNDGMKYIQIQGRKNNSRVKKWIRRNYVNTTKNLNAYKVFVPKSNGSGAIGESLSTPMIGVPMIGNTESFISIGAFKTHSEAEACLKYVKSKFARTMLGILKVTQDNPPEKWRYVPLQDFTSSSDIDWSVSVAAIDRQLYKKYQLTEEEISFIETNIQPME